MQQEQARAAAMHGCHIAALKTQLHAAMQQGPPPAAAAEGGPGSGAAEAAGYQRTISELRSALEDKIKEADKAAEAVKALEQGRAEAERWAHRYILASPYTSWGFGDCSEISDTPASQLIACSTAPVLFWPYARLLMAHVSISHQSNLAVFDKGCKCPVLYVSRLPLAAPRALAAERQAAQQLSGRKGRGVTRAELERQLEQQRRSCEADKGASLHGLKDLFQR